MKNRCPTRTKKRGQNQEGSQEKVAISFQKKIPLGKWILAGALLKLAGSYPLTGCGIAPKAIESSPYQLTEKNFACNRYPDGEQTTRLTSMPERFINEPSFRVGKVQDVRNQLTGIPSPLMDYLFKVHRQNGLAITEAPLGGSTIGETTLIGPRGSTMVPTSIRITNRPDAIFFALQHEVGHAVEGHLRQVKSSNQAQWANAFQEGRSNPKLRSYARSAPGEYFAEAFANFYCSQEAHAFLKTELPQTYGYLKEMLPPPRWDEPGGPKIDDMYVLIDDENPSAIYLYLSLPEEVASLKLCPSEKNPSASQGSCLTTGPTAVNFEKIDSKIDKRIVMKSAEPVDLKAIPEMTIVGLNTKGETVKTRKISLTQST
jgi:hypothetical protein